MARQLPDPITHEIDVEAEIADRRYARALQAVRVAGKPAHFTDRLTRALEDVLDEAVDMCVVDQLQADERADLAFDLE